MSAMAGTLVGDTVRHFAQQDRQSLTIDTIPNYVVLAYTDAAEDESVASVIPRKLFDLAVKNYLGVQP